MKYIKKCIPIQELASGDMLTIQVHTFIGNKPGPIVYLQGNLHGPEIFGTALLLRLVQILGKQKSLKGKIIIVPCANPMGVNQIAYNSMIGRWNAQSGTNWNRIFPMSPLKNHTEEISFYKNLLIENNLSIESKLAATLRTLSAGANYVLDIHTTGSSSAEHLFTYPWMHRDFADLAVPIHLELSLDDVVGAFDESHVLPFLKTLSQEKVAKVATWEAHFHGHIDNTTIAQRLTQILSWLDGLWAKKASTKPEPEIHSKSAHLCAPVAGYYAWTKKVGERVEKGDIYALVYQTKGGSIPVKATCSFTLLGVYGVAATASGEQIGLIAY